MKTIEDFFEEVESFIEYMDSRDSKTIHTNEYEDVSRELYADWQQVKVSLRHFVNSDIIGLIDDQFNSLLEESRSSRPNVNATLGYLREIENEYIKNIHPEISFRDIEAGFVNSLITDLEKVNNEKYYEYIEEAVQCVQCGAYRGAVVLGWQAAIYALYQEIENHNDPFHVEYQKKFNTTPDITVNSFWDFQKLQDRNILILSEHMGIIDKSLKDMLDRERDVRNKAAHPGIYDVGPNGTKALLETVIQLLEKLDY